MYLLSYTWEAYLVPEAEVSAVGVVPQYPYHTGEADNLFLAGPLLEGADHTWDRSYHN